MNVPKVMLSVSTVMSFSSIVAIAPRSLRRAAQFLYGPQTSLGIVGACVETPATRCAAIPVDDTVSPLLSLRVSYRRPHRVPRRGPLLRRGGRENGRRIRPVRH